MINYVNLSHLDPFMKQGKMSKNTLKVSRLEFVNYIGELLKTEKITEMESRSIYTMLQSPDQDNHFMAYKIIQQKIAQLKKKKFLIVDIRERVQTFDDILRISGRKIEDIILFPEPKNKTQLSTNAGEKIKLISEVYNEGFIFNWDDSNQYKYIPYFERKGSVWVFRYSYWATDAYCGAGFWYASSDLAEDAGRKFIEIYREWLPE